MIMIETDNKKKTSEQRKESLPYFAQLAITLEHTQEDIEFLFKYIICFFQFFFFT